MKNFTQSLNNSSLWLSAAISCVLISFVVVYLAGGVGFGSSDGYCAHFWHDRRSHVEMRMVHTEVHNNDV